MSSRGRVRVDSGFVSGSNRGRPVVELGSHWGRLGIALGSTRDRSAIASGPFRGSHRGRSGSHRGRLVLGRAGVESEPIWGRFWAESGGFLPRFGVTSGLRAGRTARALAATPRQKTSSTTRPTRSLANPRKPTSTPLLVRLRASKAEMSTSSTWSCRLASAASRPSRRRRSNCAPAEYRTRQWENEGHRLAPANRGLGCPTATIQLPGPNIANMSLNRCDGLNTPAASRPTPERNKPHAFPCLRCPQMCRGGCAGGHAPTGLNKRAAV